MVAAGGDAAAARTGRHADHREAVVVGFRASTDCAQPVDERLDPVGLLVPQLAGAVDPALATGARRKQPEERQLVDECRNLAGGDLRRGQLGRADFDVSDLFDADSAARDDPDAPAHPVEHVEETGAARIQVDVVDRDPRLGHECRGDDEGRSRGEVAGDVDGAELDALRRVDAHRGRARRDADAARAQHQLGVVARRCGLDHGRAPRGAEPGQENGRLDLRARDRQLVVDRLERPAANDHRELPVGRLDLRAHAPQRLGDALHRPRRERRVAGQREGSLLEGEETGQQPRERAGVAAVDLGRFQAAESDALHGQLVAALPHLDAERAHGGERRFGVGGAPPAADHRVSVTDGAEQERAVRDRLVAGDGEVTFERGGGLDFHQSSITGLITTP